MNESEKPKLFEQQPNESTKAFTAFRAYLEMGDQRSTAAVAKRFMKSEQLMRRWCAKFRWLERVDAYAKHFAMVEADAKAVLVREQAVDWAVRQKQQREAEWKARCELLDLANETIKRWRATPTRCGTLEGIARLLELASKLGRLAAEMPTEKTEVTGPEGGPIRVEFEQMLKKVYGEPIDVEVVSPPAPIPEETGK